MEQLIFCIFRIFYLYHLVVCKLLNSQWLIIVFLW